jgi:hypothetical protein
MSPNASCSTICCATGTGQLGAAHGSLPRVQSSGVTTAVPGHARTRSAKELMNTMMQACTAGHGERSECLAAGPAVVPGGRLQVRNGLEVSAGDLMTRRQVAALFRITSAAVATWARRGRLAEVRDQSGKPRYRRADVQALLRSRTRRRAR